ncbi:MAG: trimethylamine methyltransferase family protein [Chloroflexi bacterium]|nr:trimethylamine methyltransferase family protein [Chloroflexota bacterium]
MDIQRRARRRGHRSRLRQASSIPTWNFEQPRVKQNPLTVLSEEDILQIHEASMTILEEIGIRWLDEETLDLWEKAGARVDHKQKHTWLDRGLVMELVAKAPSSFTWRARNPQHNLHIGDNVVTFAAASGMVNISDLEGGRRPGTVRDYENILKLTQMCDIIHLEAAGCVAMHDVPVWEQHLRRELLGYTLTDKAKWTFIHGRLISQDVLRMARIIFADDLTSGGPVIGGVANVNSPLVYDKRMLGGLITMARAGQVVIVTPFVLAGAMSPITLAAAAAQQNAEALAGIALTQLVRPGAPVLYGAFLTNADMKTGGPAFGSPEAALAIAMGAQMARFYHLPHRGNGALASANITDAQAAYESLWTLWPSILSHTNILIHAAGWLEDGLTFSLEKFVIDVENLGMMQRFLQGVTVDEETLALDSIAEVGPGGHHFGTAHTQARFHNAHYAPILTDHHNFGTWQAAGATDARQRALPIWKQWLQAYEAPPLDATVREALESYVEKRRRELVGSKLYEDE